MIEHQTDPGRFGPRSALLLLLLLTIAFWFKIDYHRSFEKQEPLAEAPYGDSLVFLEEADRQFGDGEDSGAFYKPPLYTALIHWLGADTPEGRQWVRYLQMFLGLATLVLVFLLARSRGGDLAGCLAFLLLLLYAPATFYETKILDTVPALFLAVLSFFALDLLLRHEGTSKGALVVGVLFGVAALARSANLLLAVVAFLLLKPWKRPGRSVALLLGTALVVLPITLLNWSRAGDLIPVNYSEGHTFHVGNNASSRGIYTLPPGYPEGVISERIVEKFMARQALGREPSPAEQRNHSYASGMDFLLSNGTRIPGLLLDKLCFAVSAYPVSDNYSLRREQERFGLLSFFVVPFPALLLLGVIGLGLLRSKPVLPILVPIAAVFGLLLVFYVTERYRLPAAPFLAASAGVALASILSRQWQTTSSVVLSVTTAMLLLAFAWIWPMPHTREELRHSESVLDVVYDLHAARSLQEGGNPSRAAVVLARSMVVHPSSQDLEWALANLLSEVPAGELNHVAGAMRAMDVPYDERVVRILMEAGVSPQSLPQGDGSR